MIFVIFFSISFSRYFIIIIVKKHFAEK